MLSTNVMPILMPRPSAMFPDQTTYQLGMYPSTAAIMFQPTTNLYPGLAPPTSAQGLGILPRPWKSTLSCSPLSPPLLHQTKSSRSVAITSLASPSSPSTSPRGLDIGVSPPPHSPDSVSSTTSSSVGGEKTAFTIDAILSSKKRSPTSPQAGSPRFSYSSDGGISTPSPDLPTSNTVKFTSTSSFTWISPSQKKVDDLSRAHSARRDPINRQDRADVHTFPPRSADFSTSLTTIRDLNRDYVEHDSSSEREKCANTLSAEKGLKRSHNEEGAAEWNSSRAKRVRTIFTQEQLERLEQEFDRQQYMVGTERLYLAAELKLSESQVKVWFQNRRIKWRKQNFEKQQAALANFCTAEQSDSHRTDVDKDNEPPKDHLVSEVVENRTCISLEPSNTEIATWTSTVRERMPHSDGAPLLKPSRTEDVPTAAPGAPCDDSVANSFSADALKLEVKKVEERLAFRLFRRNRVQQSLMSSPSSLSNSRLIPSFRRMDKSHQHDTNKRD